MAAPIKRVVAWASREEWVSLYKELYSGDPGQQRHAIGRTSVWKCRVQHRLSTAIECTSQLVSAQLQDQYWTKTGADLDREQAIRMAYSMALVRFVNLITEPSQTGASAKPVHKVAAELGLPDWLVDMRHDATHHYLPSLGVLRTATAFTLTWLQGKFWETQLEEIDGASCTVVTSEGGHRGGGDDPTSDEEAEEQIYDVLLLFMQEHFDMLPDLKKGKLSAVDDKKIKDILIELESAVVKSRESAVQCLSEEGYVVPHDEQLQVLGVGEKDLLASEDLRLPGDMLLFWKPVLKLYHHLGLTPLLLQSLLSKVGEEGNISDRIWMGWTTEIVAAICNEDSCSMSPELSGVFTPRCEFNGRLLVDVALQHPNRFTAKLLKGMWPLVRVSLSEQQYTQLQSLLETYHATPTGDTPPADTSILTVEHLLNNGKDLMVEEPSSGAKHAVTADTGLVNSPWKMATELVDWSTMPLGACPSTDLGYTTLELPAVVDYLFRKPSTQLKQNGLTEQPEAMDLSDGAGADDVMVSSNTSTKQGSDTSAQWPDSTLTTAPDADTTDNPTTDTHPSPEPPDTESSPINTAAPAMAVDSKKVILLE